MSIDIEKIIQIAKEAGEEILKIYAEDFEVFDKADDSPLTQADKNANAVIIKALEEHYSEIPIISEENKEIQYQDRKDWDLFWLVDPLDGTKEFIKKNGEFTVNIALVQKGVPIAGVVYVPVVGETYFAQQGKGAFKRDAAGADTKLDNSKDYKTLDKVTVIASRSHLSDEVVAFVDALKAEGKEVEFLSAGSSLKFCLVAEGKADVYPRLAPTMEWDTGAAHAVVIESGKQVLNYETRMPLEYNKENLLNPWFIVE